MEEREDAQRLNAESNFDEDTQSQGSQPHVCDANEDEVLTRAMSSYFECVANSHAEDQESFYSTPSGSSDSFDEFEVGVQWDQPPPSDKPNERASVKRLAANLGSRSRGEIAKGLSKLKERRAKLAVRLRNRIEKVRRRAKQADAVKFQDKLLFSTGVLNYGFVCYIAGARPDVLWLGYSIKFVFLIALRLYLYRKEKFGYFLLDFCYFANLVLLMYLWFLPQSLRLFRIAFAFANGPLGSAVIAWRNSLVFHSLDKTTSLFIHIEPVLVTYLTRHILAHRDGRWVASSPEETGLDVCQDMLVYGLFLYMAWQFAYWVKVQVLDQEKIKRRNRSESPRKYVTSFTYMRSQKSAVGGMIRRAPHHRQHWAFGAIQLSYTIFTLSLTPLLYFYSFVHFAWLVFILSFSCWNGSCFYFEVFSSRYQEQLKQLQMSADIVDMATVVGDG